MLRLSKRPDGGFPRVKERPSWFAAEMKASRCFWVPMGEGYAGFVGGNR
jgi:hypothetical protein